MRKVFFSNYDGDCRKIEVPDYFKPRVRWTAMCRNGEVYGFQHKPFLTPVSCSKGQWLCTEECVLLCKLKKQDRNIGWKDSLISCR
jgi:hypothetical protein